MISAPDFITKVAVNTSQRLRVVVIGAGGTGSAALGKLFLLHNTIVALGGSGLDVTVFDDDVVTNSNIGRQQFYLFDLGKNKAQTLVDRFNNFGGVNWTAIPEKFSGNLGASCVVIGCVDNVAARKDIHKAMSNINGSGSKDGHVWIDCGNASNSANVILGMNARVDGKLKYIPTVCDLYHAQMENYVDSNTDSCSHEDALHKQDLGVNDFAAVHACQMLWQLIRHGSVAYQGVEINLSTGTTNSFAADPNIWAMYGYQEVA